MHSHCCYNIVKFKAGRLAFFVPADYVGFIRLLFLETQKQEDKVVFGARLIRVCLAL